MKTSMLIMVMLFATTLYILKFYLNILFLSSTVAIRQYITPTSVATSDDNVIVVLVIVCDRSEALKNIITDLIRYRKSPTRFPIVISQQCHNYAVEEVAQSVRNDTLFIKHNTTKCEHKNAYYKLCCHYKLALDYIFDQLNYSTAIVLEDDLNVAQDIFDYFSETRHLLDIDETLVCISAWNDNGKPNQIDLNASDRLYRTDFFPGLGWMLNSRWWHELSPKWPNAYWDDWLRSPEQRLNRSCIRPEISRTSMSIYGQSGTSSDDLFENYIWPIHLNNVSVHFTRIDLNYLLNENYDDYVRKQVETSQPMSIDELDRYLSSNDSKNRYSVTVNYQTAEEFIVIADRLQLVADFKSGIPRTAYHGIVSTFINNTRIYIRRDHWIGYNTEWEPIGDAHTIRCVSMDCFKNWTGNL